MVYKSYYKINNLNKLVIFFNETAITNIYFQDMIKNISAYDKLKINDDLPIIKSAKKWLKMYFSNQKPEFLPNLDFFDCSDFRKMVYEILLKIPYGKVESYGEIAKQIESKTGKRMSAQAVGGAVGSNPILIIVPCHRVIGTNGELTGYAGGLDRKLKLLKLENAL